MLSKKRKRKFDRGFRKCLQGLAKETGTLLTVVDEDSIGHTHRLQHAPIFMPGGDAPRASPSRRTECPGTSVGLSIHQSKLHDGTRTKNTSSKQPAHDRVHGSEVSECPQPPGRIVSATTNIATKIVQSYKGTTRSARGRLVDNEKKHSEVDERRSECEMFSGHNDLNLIEKVITNAEFERIRKVAMRDDQYYDPTNRANNRIGQARTRSIEKVGCRRDQLLTGRKFFFVPLGPNMGFGRLQLLGDIVLSLGGTVIQDIQSGGAGTIFVVDEGVEANRLTEFLNRKERERQVVQSTDCNGASRFQQLEAPANSGSDVTANSAAPFAGPMLGRGKKSEVPGCGTSIRATSEWRREEEARASPIAIASASENVTPAWIMHCSRHGKLPEKSRFRYPPSCEEVLFGSEGEERPGQDSEHHHKWESVSERIRHQSWLLRRTPPVVNKVRVVKDSQEREISLEEEMRNKAKRFLGQRYAEGALVAGGHVSSASNAQLDDTMNATITARLSSLSSSTSWRRTALCSTLSADEERLVGETPRPTIQLSQTDVSQHNLHYSSLVVTKEVEDFYSRNRWVEVLHSAEGTWTERKRRILCGFACSKTSLTLKNQNVHLTRPLEELMQMYEVEGDRWRHLGYKKAVSLLKNLPFRVEHAVQLEDMRGVGKGMLEKIAEILGTGRLSKLEEKRKNTELRALLAFNKIWGVGPATARKLFEEGFRSISDLKNYFLKDSKPPSSVPKVQCNNGRSRESEMSKVVGNSGSRKLQTVHSDNDFASAGEMHNERNGHGQKWAKRRPRSLTSNQRVGLQLYEDLLVRIPREEVQEIEAVVTKVAKGLCSAIEATTCGSYRRGKATCGDVDVLLTRTDQDDCDILNRLIQTLSEIGFLSHHLQLPGHHAKGHSDSYMGVCRLPTPTRNDRGGGSPTLHRRIDIKAYPRSKYPLAILYFTGSDHFNRSMRLYAKKTGWKLTDTALIRQDSVVAEWKGQHVDVESERDVFLAIGLDYKEPWERSCFDLDIFEKEEKAVRKKLQRQVT